MDELGKKRLRKKMYPTDPLEKRKREELEAAIKTYIGSFKIIEVKEVKIKDIYNLLPEEILKYGNYFIQKTYVLNNNYIAIGEIMGEDAKLYSIMFASDNPNAFIYSIKKDFGITILN